MSVPLGSDSYRPPTRQPSAFDQSIRADLDLAAGLLTLLATKEPKAEELANDATELASHVLLLDRDTKTTVLDRIRQATRGIPAASYGPSGKSTPRRCTSCDGTGWLEADPETPCRASDCTARGKDASDEDRAVCDLLSVCQLAKHLPLRAHEAMTAHRSGDPVAWKTLHRSVSELRHVFANYPPAARGGDERTQRQLERENVRAAPDCPSCARIPGFACACRESVNGRGEKEVRSTCEFCERWAKRDPDPNESAWPQLYLVVQHHRDQRARLLEENHTDRRTLEDLAKKGAAR